jgi:hypothetical protein
LNIDCPGNRRLRREDGEKLKPQAAAGIDGSWNHRRNGLVPIFDMVDVVGGRAVDFETVQKTTKSGHGNCQASSNGIEVEALMRMVKRWEHDQKITVVVTE